MNKYITVITIDNCIIAYSLNNFATCYNNIICDNEEITTHEFDNEQEYQNFLEMLKACQCNQIHLNLV